MLGHDLGHTPFGHSGERVLNELMREHGGFEHNRQSAAGRGAAGAALPGVPGAEPHLGGARGHHQASSRLERPGPAEFAPGEAPTLEAQLVDVADEIAYNNHDVDDGLSSGMFSVEAIREVALFREAHDAARARRIGDERIERHAVVRFIIDRCVRELIEATQQNLASGRVASVDDVRRAGRRLVAYSDEMASRVRELKQFLLQHMYRHYRVVRMGDKAGRILRDLFQSYVGRARPAAAALPGAGRAGRRPPHGVRLHRRHDRPLRARRAPEALRPHGAGLGAGSGRAWARRSCCSSSTAPGWSPRVSGPRATSASRASSSWRAARSRVPWCSRRCWPRTSEPARP